MTDARHSPAKDATEPDGRQWTVQREPDRDIVFGPYTGSEKVTVVPITRLDSVRADVRPEREAGLLKVNAQQAERLRQVAEENSRLKARNAELREQARA